MTMDPERTRRVRKRLWAGAFFLAIGLLVWKTFDHDERIEATIVLDLGPRAEEVTRIEADAWVKGEPAGNFTRDAQPGFGMGRPSFKASLPGADADLTIRIRIPGQLIEAHRHIVAEQGATITVQLARELPPLEP